MHKFTKKKKNSLKVTPFQLIGEIINPHTHGRKDVRDKKDTGDTEIKIRLGIVLHDYNIKNRGYIIFLIVT